MALPLLFSASPRLRGELLAVLRFRAITLDVGDHGDPNPSPHFSTLVANKALSPIDAWVILAWPLGDAWVALG
jgi:hypothetical protein